MSIWSVLLLLPSILTVLRYAADHLNADGVQQSAMSIQGPALFYWGQDRLFPAVSWLASPVSDPTANLWVCLTLQALSLYGLLLYLAVRGAGVLRRASSSASRGGHSTVVVLYVVLVAAVNALWSPAMMHSFAGEGQPYALSWLLVALAFESWRRATWTWLVISAVLAFVALGLNPSVVLLAGFLAVVQALRTRRLVRWLLFIGVMGALFVAWSFLSSAFVMYPTPERGGESQSYLSFSFEIFSTGFADSVTNVVGQLRPVRLVILLLAALGAVAVMGDALRSRLALLGSYFAGFTLLYVVVFAGNEWVMMNGFHYRYFFPLPLLAVLATALPLTDLVLQVSDRLLAARRVLPRPSRAIPLVLAVVFAAIALVGPVRAPQDAPVLTRDDATESYARAHDVAFISGGYWNMWPLMHGLLEAGRDSVYVAGFKAEGERADYRRTLDQNVRRNGKARAVCLNDLVETCRDYLDYWTRPGWRPARGGAADCPTAPSWDPSKPVPTCRVLTYTPGA